MIIAKNSRKAVFNVHFAHKYLWSIKCIFLVISYFHTYNVAFFTFTSSSTYFIHLFFPPDLFHSIVLCSSLCAFTSSSRKKILFSWCQCWLHLNESCTPEDAETWWSLSLQSSPGAAACQRYIFITAWFFSNSGPQICASAALKNIKTSSFMF